MMTSDDDRRIVQVIIDLAHSFGLQAVAEGVEDRSTLDRLGEMGCDIAQGYLFSRAMSYAEFVTWKQQSLGGPGDKAQSNAW